MSSGENGGAIGPERLARRTVGEWTLRPARSFANPFADVALDAVFTDPNGRDHRHPGFYAGYGAWKIRFNPGQDGTWQFRTESRPRDPGLEAAGAFVVEPREDRGFLRATPGEAWGFAFEDGTPVLPFGDTVYHLFGMAHCGADVRPFLERRKAQGFNLLRIRLPVSRFHPPDAISDWQTRPVFPWGGSEQAPRFDRFNLDYFRTVDEVVRVLNDLGLGVEMIMEAWGFEFPFNSRHIFVAEWEELWLRWLVARYDAFASTWLWTPLNEYEYYPNGDWNYQPVADRFQVRLSRWIKANAAHGHPVAAHNGPRLPPFAERFAFDPEAVDAIMFQDWGTREIDDGWLAAGIAESIDVSLAGWRGSATLAEWGYERNPQFDLNLPHHEFCDRDHTRRGAWQGAFKGLGIIHGFDNTWGPWMKLDEDQPGLADLLQVRRFFTEIAPFADLRPAPELVDVGDAEVGRRPLALASADRRMVAVYLPVGGAARLTAPTAGSRARWFDPRTGELAPAVGDGGTYVAPGGGGERPFDWVLVIDGVA